MRSLIIGAVAALGSLLGACNANTATALNSTLTTLSQNYAHCHHTIDYQASVGALAPTSGVAIHGTVDCPPVGPNGEPLNTTTSTSSTAAQSVASNAVAGP